MLKKEQKEN